MPRRRICFAVADVPTTSEPDEWGRALVNLVLSLARGDADVEIVSCAGAVPHEAWTRQFDLAGVRVRRVSPSVRVVPVELAKSWQTYRALRGETFDAIVFQGVEGLGSMSGLARRAGLAFGRTRLVEWFRDATERSRERAHTLAQDAGGVVTAHMERLAAESADHVVFRDEAALSWVRDQGWRLEGTHSVLRDIELADLAADAVTDELEGIVVVGGGELDVPVTDVLKDVGRRLPRDARVRVSLETGSDRDFTVASVRVAVASALDVDEGRLELDRVDRRGAFDALRARHRIAVLSLACEMTLLAHELLGERIPFVVVDERADRDTRADRDDGTFASWLGVMRPITRSAVVHENTMVSVVVTHHDRPHLVTQAVRSIGLQTYGNLELIVVDDGSTAPGVPEVLDRLSAVAMGRPLTVVRQANLYLGAARNAGVRASNGDFVAFLDDDDIAAPEYCASLVNAAVSSGADVVTCAFEMIDEHAAPDGGVMTFLGGPLAIGPVLNLMGGAGMLVRRSTFERVGGFHEQHGVGHEDWHLLVKIALDGGSILAVPEPLYRYRQHAGTMIRDRNLFADSNVVSDAYGRALPAELRGWPMMLRAFHEAVVIRDRRIDGLQRRVAELEHELDRRRRYLRVLHGSLAGMSSSGTVVNDAGGVVRRTVSAAHGAARRLWHAPRRAAMPETHLAQTEARELFDEAHYRSQTPVPDGVEPFDHFRAIGWHAGFDPHPVFSVRWYLHCPPTDRGAGFDPLTHFVQVGWREGRDPHPLFDVGWYLSTAPDVARAEVNPLLHYLVDGWREGRDPHPLFEAERYLESRPDVRRAQTCPLVHYVTHGWREGGDPSSIFDAAWYVARRPGGVLLDDLPPYWHYLEVGAPNGDLPGPWAASL